MSRGIYISAKEAAVIISENIGRTVSDQYVRDYARKGKITYRPLDGRTNEYLKSDVEKLHIKRNRRKVDKQEGTSIPIEKTNHPLEDVA